MDKYFAVSTNRDINAGIQFEAAMTEGRFEQEYTLYGTLYWQDGEIGYYHDSQLKRVYDFIDHCVYNDCYPTPMMTMSAWGTLLESHRISSELISILEENLHRIYNEKYFQLLEKMIASTVDNNSGQWLIDEYSQMLGTDQLGGWCFQSVLKQGLWLKVITVNTYGIWQNKPDHIAPMIGQLTKKTLNEKMFYGFGYYTDHWQYGLDGCYEQITGKKQVFDCQGILTTPLYVKRYGGALGDGQHKILRADFLRLLEHDLDASYLKVMQALWSKASAKTMASGQQTERYHHQLDQAAYQSLIAYGFRWGLIKK